jgi:hypothetical protein
MKSTSSKNLHGLTLRGIKKVDENKIVETILILIVSTIKNILGIQWMRPMGNSETNGQHF